MVKTVFITLALAFVFACANCQPDTSLHHSNSSRVWITAGGNAAFWAGSYVALNKAWYAGYPHSSFHFFNDNEEWNQMDKAGHAWTSYSISRLSYAMWRWAGIRNNAAAVLGGAGGLAYQSIIELQDAYSSQWGFSWGDMGANLFGAALFVGQQVWWKDQRIVLKLGYTPYRYPSQLLGRRNSLFGTGIPERILKDYNSQTYWLSFNLRSLVQTDGLPAWLNLAVGYGSDGMFGARSNRWMDADGAQHDFGMIPRTRRFYLSPDIDLEKIRSKRRWVRTVLFVLNAVKIPSPALELNSRGQLRGHWLKF